MPAANEERPPYIVFRTDTVEDRNKTIAAGHYVGQDVDMVIVSPIGSKDRIERVWTDFVKMKEQEVSEGRFNPMWLQAYKSIYKDWKEGKNLPENGTPILTWPLLSPSQAQVILNANIRTVEDLAQATEQAINAIGMGARALVQKAQEWVASSNDIGRVIEESVSLKVENAMLKARVEELEQANAAFKAQIGVSRQEEVEAA